MKREDLEKLGLSEEQINGVMKLKSNAMNEIDTLNNKITQLTADKENLQTQLKDANNEIQSYKDMDIDSIKQSASNWETKYNDLVKEQKEAQEKSIREERTNAFFNEVKFASDSAKAGVIAKFNEKDFKYDEETKTFLGANDWLKDLKEKDAGAFLSDVANPRFTTNPTTPANNSSMDEVMKIMGLAEEKK